METFWADKLTAGRNRGEKDRLICSLISGKLTGLCHTEYNGTLMQKSSALSLGHPV